MRAFFFLGLLSTHSLLTGCGGQSAPAQNLPATMSADLAIEGMTCASCSITIKTALRRLDGLVDVSIDVDKQRAAVQYNGDALSAEEIEQAITHSGYKATLLTTAPVSGS